jgi:two-component system, NarL family, sensor kinase
VKPYNAPRDRSERTDLQALLGSASHDMSDRLYWKFSSDLLFIVRPSYAGSFVYEAVNPAFESLLGAPDEIREMTACDYMGSEDTKSVNEAFDTCLAKGTEVRLRHQLVIGRSPRNVETIVSPICDIVTGAIVRLVGSHRIASEGSPEAAPERNSAGLTEMSAESVSVHENMQQRIASDLHDSTCQHLIAASLLAMRMRSSLDEATKAEQLCQEIEASIDRALREIRAFAYVLHPQNLAEAGLKEAIEQYSGGFGKRTSLKVSTNISPEVDRLPYETQRSLLRVVQEALANVFRHAKATEVVIAIEAIDRHFELSVSDDGCGMSAGRSAGSTRSGALGVGIPAMKIRLQQIGGTLEIPSLGPGQSGTTIRAVFPRRHTVGNTQSGKSGRSHQNPHKPVINRTAER